MNWEKYFLNNAHWIMIGCAVFIVLMSAFGYPLPIWALGIISLIIFVCFSVLSIKINNWASMQKLKYEIMIKEKGEKNVIRNNK
jgi:hypothetical protein